MAKKAPKKAPNKILTINAGPDTFTSELPSGVHGSTELLEALTVENIDQIDIDNVGEYEEKYRIYFKNGDEIQFDGYSGLWELKTYDRLSKKAKVQAVKDLRDMLEYHVKG